MLQFFPLPSRAFLLEVPRSDRHVVHQPSNLRRAGKTTRATNESREAESLLRLHLLALAHELEHERWVREGRLGRTLLPLRSGGGC